MLSERQAILIARWGWQLTLAGNPRGGAAALQEAVSAYPDRADFVGALGLSFAKDKQLLEAVRMLEKSIALDPNQIDFCCALGELALDVPKFELAASALARCLSLDPEAKHPAGIRARALIKRGEKLTKEALGRR